jgi:hypothetical protein
VQLPSPCQLRWRSAPWDDIITADVATVADTSEDDVRSESSYDSLQDVDGSPQLNLLPKKQTTPTHYNSVVVPPIPPQSDLSRSTDNWTQNPILQGADLPPPAKRPREFQRTMPSTLMDQVISDLQQHNIIREQRVINAFKFFLIAKP